MIPSALPVTSYKEEMRQSLRVKSLAQPAGGANNWEQWSQRLAVSADLQVSTDATFQRWVQKVETTFPLVSPTRLQIQPPNRPRLASFWDLLLRVCHSVSL